MHNITIPRRTWAPDTYKTTPLSPCLVKLAGAIIVHHSGIPTTKDPRHDMRVVDAVDRARAGQAVYNYAIHPSGAILEGSGCRVGAHTPGMNRVSYGALLLGDYHVDELTVEAVYAFRTLRRWLVDGRLATHDVRVEPHQQYAQETMCPGPNVLVHWDDLTGTHRPTVPSRWWPPPERHTDV